MDKKARLLLFYQKLSEALAAATHDEALKLLCDTLNGVEDEHSNVVFNPDNWETDGRMYPPEVDNAFAVDGFSEVVRYRSARHNAFIGGNGAIEVKDFATGIVEFTKLGANGKGVWG